MDLTLANRDAVEFNMLLGRDAFMDAFSWTSPFVQGDISDADIESLYKAYDEEKTGLRIGVLAPTSCTATNASWKPAPPAAEMVFLNVEHSYMKLDVHSPEIGTGAATSSTSSVSSRASSRP